MSKIPTLTAIFKHDLEKIEFILTVFALAKNKPIRPFEMTVLKYYMKYGFTDEAVQYIKEDEGKKDGDIRVANTHLREKGYLKLGVNNLRKSTLSDELESLRKNFVLENKNLYALYFENSQV